MRKKFYVSVDKDSDMNMRIFLVRNNIQHLAPARTGNSLSYVYLLSLDEVMRTALTLSVSPEWVREALW